MTTATEARRLVADHVRGKLDELDVRGEIVRVSEAEIIAMTGPRRGDTYATVFNVIVDGRSLRVEVQEVAP